MSQETSCPSQGSQSAPSLHVLPAISKLTTEMSLSSPKLEGDMLGSLCNPILKGPTQLSRREQMLLLYFPQSRLKCSGSLSPLKMKPLQKITIKVNNFPCCFLSPSSVPQFPPSTFNQYSGSVRSPAWRYV